jgi:TonB family protein
MPPGASVSVDGKAAGTTPVYLTGLAAGSHALKVVAANHAPAELTVDVSGAGPPVPLRFDLQPLVARLQLESKPPDAVLEVDGERKGQTPVFALQLSAGTHRISVGKDGFRNWTRVVDARPGETVTLAAQLQPKGDPPPRDALRRQGWVLAGDLVELSPNVTPPRRVSASPPSYPAAAKKLHLRGTVTVELTVTEAGAVADARIVQSAGDILDHALLESVRAWRYEPAQTNGVKVKVRIRESQSFEPGA